MNVTVQIFMNNNATKMDTLDNTWCCVGLYECVHFRYKWPKNTENSLVSSNNEHNTLTAWYRNTVWN